MRIESSLLVDLNLERPSVIDQLRNELAVEKVMPGRVISENSPGRYQVLVGGQRLVFMPSKPLEVGAQFTARLVEGRLVLDFPATGTAPTQTSASSVTLRTLPELLVELGLPADSRNIAVLQGLVRAGVSLTPEALQLFQQYAGVASQEEAVVLALAVQRAIPVDRSLIKVLREIFQDNKRLGEVLSGILSELSGLGEQASAMEAAKVFVDWLERLRRQLSRLDPETPLKHLPAELRRAVAEGGVFRESHWALALAEGADKEPLHDLKSMLLDFLQELENLEQKSIELDITRLRELLQAGVNRIEQLQVSSVRAPWEGRQIWILEIPLWIEGKPDSFRMVIEGKPSDKKTPMEPPLRVDLFLDFTLLGTIRISLSLLNGGVEGQVFSDQPEVIELLNQATPLWLTERRQSDGDAFPLRSLIIRKATESQYLYPPELLNWEAWHEKTLHIGRVDIRA